MSNFNVKKVAVLGAGVMGAQIAAHCVNAKVPVVLFDLPGKEGTPKNGIVLRAIENLKKMSPAPFGDKVYLYPINFLMQMIEFAAKTVSHGMRLFGNMFAGELIFMWIALMGGTWAWQFNPAEGMFWLGIGHVIAGTAWSIFHILVITLQAFIFMMLTLIYVGQAHDSH